MFKHNTLSFHTSLLIPVASSILIKILIPTFPSYITSAGLIDGHYHALTTSPYKFNKSSSSTINYGINLLAFFYFFAAKDFLPDGSAVNDAIRMYDSQLAIPGT